MCVMFSFQFDFIQKKKVCLAPVEGIDSVKSVPCPDCGQFDTAK